MEPSEEADLPSWVAETHRAIQEVRKLLQKGPRVEITRLRRAVKRFLRTHRRFQHMADLFRTHASEHGEGSGTDLQKMIRESERLSREQDYTLSGWLEDLSELLKGQIELDRELAEGFPAFLEEVRSLPKDSRFRAKRHARFWEWLRQATPEQEKELQEAFRRDIDQTQKILREFRRAAEQIVERSVKEAVQKRRSKNKER